MPGRGLYLAGLLQLPLHRAGRPHSERLPGGLARTGRGDPVLRGPRLHPATPPALLIRPSRARRSPRRLSVKPWM
ncbi:hypothetical protein SGPA1_11851 [Streptomyces misionensis JCM 4497]